MNNIQDDVEISVTKMLPVVRLGAMLHIYNKILRMSKRDVMFMNNQQSA